MLAPCVHRRPPSTRAVTSKERERLLIPGANRCTKGGRSAGGGEPLPRTFAVGSGDSHGFIFSSRFVRYPVPAMRDPNRRAWLRPRKPFAKSRAVFDREIPTAAPHRRAV